MKILIDCMGGDNAPHAVVEGVALATKDFSEEIVLLGAEDELRPLLEKHKLNVEIINTSDNITSDDDAMDAIKNKRNSSMVVGLSALREGDGDAFVSAGNTGALVGAATLFARRIKGVKRMALSPLIPTKKGMTLLIDAGANVDCNPEFLAQFGVMGSIYMQKVHKIERPRVGLLNVGTEISKGHALIRETHGLLEQDDSINFIGNIEARDVFDHACDVLVADGFTGNVLLKTLEGTASMMSHYFKKAIYSNFFSKMGGLLVKPSLMEVYKTADYSKYGGAPMLGANGTVIKAHGSSGAEAFYHAIRQAIEFTKTGVTEAIGEKLS